MKTKIYKIVNDVNNKIYIGQTIRPLKTRFKAHIRDAKRDWQVNKFHHALIDIGEEHFKIELIGEYDKLDADYMESYYIKLYDSFNNGYNSTSGGGGGGVHINEKLRKNIYNMYMQGYTRINIANITGYNPKTVSYILMELGIEPDFGKNTAIKIAMYNKCYTLEKIFNSKYEAYNYILTENEKCDKQAFYGHIKTSFKTGCIRYGHRWVIASNKSCNELEHYFDNIKKIDNTKKLGNKHNTKKLDSKQNNNMVYIKCKVCGKDAIKHGNSGMCRSCLAVSSKGKSQKPSKEQLIQDTKIMNKKQIALKYDRSASTVSYWFKSYNIL